MGERARFASIAVVVLLLASSSGGGVPTTAPVRKVTPVPDEIRRDLKLADFYQQHVDADGLSIVGSAKVSPYALLEGAYLIDRMLDGRDDIRKGIAAARIRVTIMAASEMTTDVPEHSDLKPAEYWNRRARGLGATRRRPSISGGEENLLEMDGDPYRGENILIHEFAHTVHEIGMAAVDPTFDKRLRQAFEAALEKGLWKNTYAATNRNEYWAEGVQCWFDCNQAKGGVHNHIRTRDAIKEYDPGLAALLLEVFGDKPWRYEKPTKRAESPHLDGLDRSKLPRFRWPANAPGLRDA